MSVLRGVCAALALCLATPANADPPRLLGWSYAVTNDSIGQFRDRWQSSLISGSVFLSFSASDPVTARPGEIWEIRATSQIITPESLDRFRPGDRPFAGILALGAFTHGRIGATELAGGVELSAVGPQTGTFRFQRWLHEILGYPLPRTAGNEIPDAIHFNTTVEAARRLGPVRPFAEIRTGAEPLIRIGADLSFGALGADDLMVREPVTGHRLPGLMGPDISGWSWLAGADIAYVADSAYLPERLGFEPVHRARLRAGAHWQTDHWSAFYGVTWLSPEFQGQRESQLVGAAQLRLRF